MFGWFLSHTYSILDGGGRIVHVTYETYSNDVEQLMH